MKNLPKYMWCGWVAKISWDVAGLTPLGHEHCKPDSPSFLNYYGLMRWTSSLIETSVRSSRSECTESTKEKVRIYISELPEVKAGWFEPWAFLVECQIIAVNPHDAKQLNVKDYMDSPWELFRLDAFI